VYVLEYATRTGPTEQRERERERERQDLFAKYNMYSGRLPEKVYAHLAGHP